MTISMQLNTMPVSLAPLAVVRSNWRRLPVLFGRLLSGEVSSNPRPDWARVSGRSWQRHSAYLTAVRERRWHG